VSPSGPFVVGHTIEVLMSYVVIIERTAECPTAVVKANTTLRDFKTLWRPMLDEVWAFLGSRPSLRGNGHNVMLYRNGLPEVELAVEVGVQVLQAFEPLGHVVPSTLPAGLTAMTVHKGDPSQIGAAHDAVRAWCSKEGRELTGTSWEIYGDPDPKTGNFDVSVYWQLSGSA
jgi:effector-binding domain-containing protein